MEPLADNLRPVVIDLLKEVTQQIHPVVDKAWNEILKRRNPPLFGESRNWKAKMPSFDRTWLFWKPALACRVIEHNL